MVSKSKLMKKVTVLFFLLALVLGSVYAQRPTPKPQYTYKTLTDVPYRDGSQGVLTDYMKERCVLDLYYPTDLKDFPTIVWFHGGGIKFGEKHIPETLKNEGMAIIAVNYRLHPKVKCPAYIEDAAASVAWAFKNIETYGGNKDLIFVSGHSAGGYLASMIGLDQSYLRKHNVEANTIAGLIPYSGHTITHFTIREERGIEGTEVVVDKFAPISHIRKDAPPYIIITGDREQELLGRYEENAYMYRMMKVIGHEQTTLMELDGFNHGEMAAPAHHLLVKHIDQYLEKVRSDER